MLYFLFLVVVLVLLGSIVYASVSLAPWAPTSDKDLDLIKNIVKLGPGQKRVECGSGTGHVSLTMSRAFSQAHIIGLELALPLFLMSWLRIRASGQKNIFIKRKDGFSYDYSDVDVVYLFGMPQAMSEKVIKIADGLPVGGRIISYQFLFDDERGDLQEHKAHKGNIYERTKKKES